MADEPARFRFGPLEQRGLIAGLRTAQVGLLAGGLGTAVGLVRLRSSALGLGAALLVVGAAAAFAFVDVGGRSLEQWAPAATRFGFRRLIGQHRSAPTDAPARGSSAGGPAERASAGRPRAAIGAPGPLPVPAALAGFDFFETPRVAGRDPLGVISDRRRSTLTAVLAVRGRSFALLDPQDKAQRLASWAGVLTAMAREGSPVHRLQWIERTVGGDADALQRHFEAARAVNLDTPAACSYRELVAEAGPATEEHECFVALSIRVPARWREWLSARRSPGRQGAPAQSGVALLQREVRLLEGQLRNADISVHGACSLGEVAAMVRTAFAPDERAILARRAARSDGPRDGPPMVTVWPAATVAHWDTYRTDDYWHATFWIAEWPRTDVGPDFLAPLLLQSGGRRTVALVMAPVPAGRGVREVEAARTASAADEELRRRAGFLSTARRLREAEGVARRERELSEGHASYCFCGYVTASAATYAELQDSCAQLVQVANQCHLALRRLHGAHDMAFIWTLPFGLGLR